MTYPTDRQLKVRYRRLEEPAMEERIAELLRPGGFVDTVARLKHHDQWPLEDVRDAIRMAIADLVPLDVLADDVKLFEWFTTERTNELRSLERNRHDAMEYRTTAGLEGMEKPEDVQDETGFPEEMADALPHMPEVRARLSPELAKLLDAYVMYGNERSAADALGMNDSTFHRWLLKARTEATAILGCLQDETCLDLAA